MIGSSIAGSTSFLRGHNFRLSDMNLSVSNIALPAFDHAALFPTVRDLGFTGLEIAPSRQWHDTWRGLTSADVTTYRRDIERADLRCVGLHSLFYDHPELGLFRDTDKRIESLDFLVHLSGVCRDLGGKTLIWGGGRNRGDVPRQNAIAECLDFVGTYAHRTTDHGTCLCFEPLGPKDSDFINAVHESVAIAEAINHPSVRVQVDAKALVQNKEMSVDTVAAAKPWLVHAHANEPDLGILGTSGNIDHAMFGGVLREVGYDGFVSLEQKQVDLNDPIGPLTQSSLIMKEAYT